MMMVWAWWAYWSRTALASWRATRTSSSATFIRATASCVSRRPESATKEARPKIATIAPNPRRSLRAVPDQLVFIET